MSETKEQIRTELINELMKMVDEYITIDARTLFNKLQSMLPTETPEKIAERKAVEILVNKGWNVDSTVKQMLIEALLTDIKK